MHESQRFIPSIAPVENELVVRNLDVDQAFAQVKSEIHRKIYVRLNFLLGYLADFLFETFYPLYGLPE